MDDMNGTNWTTLTQSPVINGYIYAISPWVAVDGTDRIYIADAESYQPAVIRVDEMTGANWTAIYLGSNSTPHSIAVDASGIVPVGTVTGVWVALNTGALNAIAAGSPQTGRLLDTRENRLRTFCRDSRGTCGSD